MNLSSTILLTGDSWLTQNLATAAYIHNASDMLSGLPMTFRESITSILMTKARRERAAYWRSLPLQRLWMLAVAAFLLFAVNGLLTTMLTASATRLVNGLSAAIYAGTVTVFYLLVIARKPIMIPLLVTIQVLTSIALARFQNW